MFPFVVWTSLAVAALLSAEYTGSQTGKWIAKPIASTGFVAAALAMGAASTSYGSWILAGLALSWLGDVLLIPTDRPAVFQAGVLSFLLGHVAYACAFVALGLAPIWLIAAAVLFGAIGAGLFDWLRPYVPAGMKAAAYAYMAVISVMVILAAAATGRTGYGEIFVGAFAFYLSDISVARDRFMESAFFNRLWGLPLYFVGQLILASTVVHG
jgi:uncharacterized membrane protein YhhN